MVKYKCYKWKPFDKEFLLMKFDKPYSFLSRIFEGNETSDYIIAIIEGVKKTKNLQLDDYGFGNQSGFQAIALKPDPADPTLPNGGVDIYDMHGNDENAILTISLDEMLEILESFKKFLTENRK
ncbi:hypothetical protein ACI513_12160 [Chryseobacterium sp. M5]|uniref:hypothetical protein n=1 Tax=Chryseobacterium sp. M5 TaxID=3379128 RepID=UPI003857C2A7